MAEGVQPAPNEGEGQGTQPNEAEGLYSQFLDGIPEEFHGTITERLKAQDADVTKRFQSQAETWKPYEELGINEVDPEALGGLLTLGQAFEAAAGGDQEAQQAVQEWVGENLGFLGGEGEGEEEGQASDLLDLSPDQLKEMVGEQVAGAVNPLLERFEQQEQQQQLAEAEQQVSDSLATLRKDNPNLDDEDESRILAFAYMFGQESEDPISAGFEEFKKVAARGESQLFGEKLNQPSPAEAGGRPNTTSEAPGTFADASRSALERLRVGQQA